MLPDGIELKSVKRARRYTPGGEATNEAAEVFPEEPGTPWRHNRRLPEPRHPLLPALLFFAGVNQVVRFYAPRPHGW